MSDSLSILQVSGKSDLRKFLQFPFELYKDSPYYISEPLISLENKFSKKNPFLRDNNVNLFMAVRGNKTVGRIAFIENKQHNQLYNDNACFFGFYDVNSDQNVSDLLLDTVKHKAKDLKYSKIIGPTNFTTNDTCGILILGFDKNPVMLMPYNEPYYQEHLESYGFVKSMDLYSFLMQKELLQAFLERPLIERVKRRLEKSNISFRTIKYKGTDDLKVLQKLYNESNRGNWGFLPLSDDEFEFMANDLRIMIPEDYIVFAMRNNVPVGFAVAIPNYNEVFKRIRDGKMFPFGIVKYLWFKRKIKGVRVLILGVTPVHKKTGIDLLLYQQISKQVNKRNVVQGEACYVMEGNTPMYSILSRSGGEIVNTYRIYSLDL
jgi:hypothetical protein